MLFRSLLAAQAIEATVEVYRYFDGLRRKERFTIQPGDAIGVAKGRDGIAYETGFFLVDVYADPTIERGGTDRRPASVAVVQNTLGDRYEIRIPREELNSDARIGFEDEIELAKSDADAAKAGEKGAGAGDAKGSGSSGAGGSGAGGKGSGGNADSPYGK